MKDWDRIRAERRDLTDYVLHLTKRRAGNGRAIPAFEVLKEIITARVLTPTFAIRETRYRNHNPNVRGPDPAVCYTEQPLHQLLITLRTLGTSRYDYYGFAFQKVDLHEYGGRPVIYGDDTLMGKRLGKEDPGYQESKEIWMGGLAPDQQYLWVRYIPRRPGYPEAPVDFAHEREWRCKVRSNYQYCEHLTGIPVLLPAEIARMTKHGQVSERDFSAPQFRILVRRNEEVPTLREFMNKLVRPERSSTYEKVYSEALKKVQIISLEKVAEQIKAGDVRFEKIETLPNDL